MAYKSLPAAIDCPALAAWSAVRNLASTSMRKIALSTISAMPLSITHTNSTSPHESPRGSDAVVTPYCTVTEPNKLGFKWSWNFQTPALSNVNEYDSPVANPFFASKPGKAVCVGCGPEAGQCSACPLFTNVTVVPAATVTWAGSKPESVIEILTAIAATGVLKAAAVGEVSTPASSSPVSAPKESVPSGRLLSGPGANASFVIPRFIKK